MEEIYVTVTGFAKYYGKMPFSIGNVLVCVKEPDNKYDTEAISVRIPIVGRVGYIANSVQNIAGGTMSAGRIYDRVGDKFYIRVKFITQSKIICLVENGDNDALEEEIRGQIMSAGEYTR